MQKVTLFISAVSDEFSADEGLSGDYRRFLRDRLRGLPIDVWVQEDFSASGLLTLDKILEYLHPCEIVVHLVGEMTGATASQKAVESILTDARLNLQPKPALACELPFLRDEQAAIALAASYTQWEAYLALALQKRLILCRAESKAPRGSRYVRELSQVRRQEDHVKRLRELERHIEVSFASPEDLTLQLFRVIAKFLAESVETQATANHLQAEANQLQREMVETLKRFISTQSHKPPVPTLAEPLAPEARSRSRMLQRVRAYWIHGVLDQAINESNRFDVGHALAPDAMLRRGNIECVLPAIGTDFGRLFDYVGANTLILGSPGSGKTILLLQLARRLLDRASEDAAQPIPVVLNLSTWWKTRQPLAEWVVSETASAYQVPRRVAARWMGDDALALLLDGLDEVISEHRDACVDAINTFRAERAHVPMAVCSRVGDYEPLKSKLDLRVAVILQDLDQKQVAQVLERAELSGLRDLMPTEPWLAEMARTPFALNVLSYAYAKKTVAELRLPTGEQTADARKQHMLDTYVARRLADARAVNSRGRNLMTAQQVRSLLRWLATGMVNHGQGTFHIEGLQPTWLKSVITQSVYCVWSRIVFGTTISLLIWAFSELVVRAAMLVIVPLSGSATSPTSATRDQIYRGLVMFAIEFAVWMLFFSGSCAAYLRWARATAGRPLLGRILAVIGITAMVAATFVIVFIPSFALLDSQLQHDSMQPEAMFNLLCFFAVAPICISLAIGLISLVLPSKVPTSVYQGGAGAAWGIVLTICVVLESSRDTALDGLEMSLFMGLFFGVMLGTTSYLSDEIQTAEQIRWKFQKRAALLWSLLPLVCLVIAVLDVKAKRSVYINEIIGFSVVTPLIAAIAGSLSGFKRVAGVQRRLTPNEGVFRSVRTAIFLSAAFGGGGVVLCAIALVVGSHLFGVLDRKTFVLTSVIVGLVSSSIGAVIGGADVPVKHAVLRMLLTLVDRKPLRLRRALDAMADLLLLRRVGGGYIFVHRYLLEHFAGRDAVNSTPVGRGSP